LRGAPDERRRFLDRGLVGLHPSWLASMAEYRRAIGHRNALLRRLGPRPGQAGLRELEAWDERLVAAATRIHVERRRYAIELGSRLGAAGRVLFPDDQDLVLRYLPSPARTREEDPDRFAEVFHEELRRGRDRDLGLGFTHTGPHRDDLTVELDEVDLRTYGSAGQLRAALVVLKLAKLALLKEEREEAPVFLMDDYDTDLDEERARNLAAHLQEGGFQAIVATSKEALVDRLGVPIRVVRVRGGEIETDG
jgi:DNA replication and repair protein RecF